MGNCTGGSNPPLSAKDKAGRITLSDPASVFRDDPNEFTHEEQPWKQKGIRCVVSLLCLMQVHLQGIIEGNPLINTVKACLQKRMR